MKKANGEGTLRQRADGSWEYRVSVEGRRSQMSFYSRDADGRSAKKKYRAWLKETGGKGVEKVLTVEAWAQQCPALCFSPSDGVIRLGQEPDPGLPQRDLPFRPEKPLLHGKPCRGRDILPSPRISAGGLHTGSCTRHPGICPQPQVGHLYPGRPAHPGPHRLRR